MSSPNILHIDLIPSRISYISIKNKSRPNTEPWGTMPKISNQLGKDLSPVINETRTSKETL